MLWNVESSLTFFSKPHLNPYHNNKKLKKFEWKLPCETQKITKSWYKWEPNQKFSNSCDEHSTWIWGMLVRFLLGLRFEHFLFELLQLSPHIQRTAVSFAEKNPDSLEDSWIEIILTQEFVQKLGDSSFSYSSPSFFSKMLLNKVISILRLLKMSSMLSQLFARG